MNSETPKPNYVGEINEEWKVGISSLPSYKHDNPDVIEFKWRLDSLDANGTDENVNAMEDIISSKGLDLVGIMHDRDALNILKDHEKNKILSEEVCIWIIDSNDDLIMKKPLPIVVRFQEDEDFIEDDKYTAEVQGFPLIRWMWLSIDGAIEHLIGSIHISLLQEHHQRYGFNNNTDIVYLALDKDTSLFLKENVEVRPGNPNQF